MSKNRIMAIMLLVLMAFSILNTAMHPVYAGIETIEVLTNGNTQGYVKVKDNTAGANFSWSDLLTKYKNIIIGISGVAALTFLIFFIVNFSKLGSSAGNPQMRSQALMGIVWCGLACAALGGIAIFFGFFYGALTRA